MSRNTALLLRLEQTPTRYTLTVLRHEAAKAGLLLPANLLRDRLEDDEFVDLEIRAADHAEAARQGAQYAINHGLSYWEVCAVSVVTLAGGPHLTEDD